MKRKQQTLYKSVNLMSLMKFMSVVASPFSNNSFSELNVKYFSRTLNPALQFSYNKAPTTCITDSINVNSFPNNDT